MLTGFLRAYLGPYRSKIALIAVLQLVQTACVLLLPTLNALVVDRGVLHGALDYIVGIGLGMAAVTGVQVGVTIAAGRIGAAVAAGLGRDVRSAVFRAVLRLSAREVNQFGTPSLITRTVNDVAQAQTLALNLFDVALSATVLSLGGLVLALTQDMWLGLLLVLAFLAICGCIAVMLVTMSGVYDRLQHGLDLVGRILREQILGVRVVRAFGQQQRERDRFAAANLRVFEPSLRVGRLLTSFAALVTLVTNVGMAALIWFGGRRVDAGTLRLGTLTALVGYLSLIVLAMVMTLVVLTSLSRAVASVRRITEVLHTEPTVREPAGPVPPVGRGGRLELRDVAYAHPGCARPVLHGVSLVADPGQTVAIVGGTGSGKSTLLHLVLRQFDVTAGAVLLDGTDVRHLGAEHLGRLVAVVPQTPRLFSGTLRDNLRFGDPDADDARLWHALAVAQVDDVVRRLPDGLDGVLARGALDLSGGQRQRLAIARALLRRPRLLLLDDCFSALDAGTEARLRAALRAELTGTTVLLTSQRVGALAAADRIAVLDGGRIVGAGTHADLLRDNDVYREFVRAHPPGERIASRPGGEIVDARPGRR
ncbi:ATP-binding cassette subfamily B protein [Krasilnikovia cinnamomea]|uniref:ATP-binding cassette subfamily B protein n=1 Tax=Krasilnikovia cinnamomea TaxID=349313 RepID=A0A4V2G7W5_9ACTN|nr:ABC transporter ATP-binding protein [Krasilnikovia cinnamomea]RZU54176.1 ATP-binding cassette subfamily B protein [Krasilnikovia cinnamomea]